MLLTVLGGGGPWPVRGQGCSGYLLTHHNTTLLIDPGPGTLGELLARCDAHQVDAVLISHAHADHTSDLISLLRARRMTHPPAPALPVYAPAGALDAVLALDPADAVAGSTDCAVVTDGTELDVAGVRVRWQSLPHHVHNLGMRLHVEDAALVYTGDSGATDAIAALASGASVLLAEATYLRQAPTEDEGLLSTAAAAGRAAQRAQVGQLVLTHLWPGSDVRAARTEARRYFSGPVQVAHSGLRLQVGS